MAWPAQPLPVEVGLYLNGEWIDAVTTGNGVRLRNDIDISHGRSGWSAIADPSQASFTLDNRDGRWSPDNPTGPYYGHLRRNVPCRIGVGRGEMHMRPTSVPDNMASTPNHASLDILGDIDLRAEFELERDLVDVQVGGSYARVAHRAVGADGWEWELYNSAGRVRSKLIWRDSGGVTKTCHTGETGSELPLDFLHEHRALRVTLDVNNGAAGYTVTWYTSTTLAGTWTQLGTPVVVAGTTSIKTSTALLRVGANPGDTIHIPLPGKFYGFELRSSIGGTIVANPAFNSQTAGATTWTDSAGRVWTVGSGGRITNMLWRFHGELASLPVRWDIAGIDVTAPVEATGLFRRLRQGNRRFDSALRRGLLAQANSAFGSSLVGYWPLEETGRDLTLFGAAVGGGPMIITGGTPNTGSFTGFQASTALPVVSDAVLTATVDTYSPATEWQVRWLQNIPAGTTSGGVWLEIIRITTTSLTWVVQWQDTGTGNMRVLALNSGGTTVYTGGAIGMNATGKAFRVSLAVTPNGANVDFDFQAQVAGGSPGGVVVTSAVAGAPGRVTEIKINKDSNLDTWAFGHVTLQNDKTPTTELINELNAYNGERAATRIQRLCREEGIATRIEGDPADTEAMGPQRPGTLMDLLQECALTDLGILCESRETVAVGYRTRASMTGQPVILDLDYTAGDVGRSPALDRDDARFANDITLTNWTGATARAVLDDGSPMSIAEPPIGAGRYQTTYDLNAYSDARLVSIATAVLGLSSVDEPRVSALTLAMHHAALVADTALTSAVFDSSLGDLVQVTNNLPAALGSTPIRQLVQGVRERISAFEHVLELDTSPASPWDAILLGGDAPESLSVTESATNTPGTSHVVALPAATIAGEMLLAFLEWNSDCTVTGPGGGWTKLRGDASSPGQSEVWAKIATGADGSSATWTTSTSQAGAFHVRRITGNKGGLVAGVDYDIAVNTAATTANPNPPSVSAGWGAANNLFVCSAHYRGGNQVMSAYPADYTLGDYQVTTNGGGGGAGVATAVRQLAAASDDPGIFTLAASEFARCYTVVIAGGDVAAPDSIPAPTIPAWDATGAITLGTLSADIAAAVAAQPDGTKFQLVAGTYTNASNIRPKTGMRFQGPASGVAVFEGTGKAYCFRAINATGSSDNVIWSGPPGSIKIQNYGSGTTRSQYGAITAQSNDVVAGNFDEPGCATGWIVHGVEFNRNSSNGLRIGDNCTVYQCTAYGHTVTGIGGDRNVGGLIHSCTLGANGLDPATGVGSNGANIKITWHNADEGRTSVVGVVRSKAQLTIANCTFTGTYAGVTGDTEIGLWLDLECKDVEVWDCTWTNHPWSGIILEGCNDILVKRGTITNSDGYGAANGEDFVAGAMTIAESNNVTVDGLTIADSVRAVIVRQSNRSGDWYKPTPIPDDFVNVAWTAGPRYWITNTQTPRPGVGSRGTMWTANVTCKNMVLTNCDKVQLSEGTNTGGTNAMTTSGSLPLSLLVFGPGNNYSGSTNLVNATSGGGFFDRSTTGLSLASWKGLPYARDNA